MIDKTMTHRLIGASIIVLSAAIVLPFILDGERPEELDIQVNVTTPPAFPVVEIATVQPLESETIETVSAEEKRPEDITLIPISSSSKEAKKTSQARSVTSEPKVEPVTKTSKEQKTTTVAERWVVQIATFKSRDNATRLVEKLKAAKYGAFSKTTSALHKVYVGPEFKRSTSEKIRDDIKKKFNLAGIVVKFSVN